MRRTFSSMLTSILAAGVLLLGIPGSACACSCTDLTDAEAFEEADAVFTAYLTDSDRAFAPFEAPKPPKILEFEVAAVYKGEVAERQGITTPSDTCAAEQLQVGEEYLVFASFHDGNLHSSLCGGSRPLDEATPFPNTDTSAPRAGEADLSETNPWPPIAAASALAVAVVGIAWWRIRRRTA